jgi:hypothetical protein
MAKRIFVAGFDLRGDQFEYLPGVQPASVKHFASYTAWMISGLRQSEGLDCVKIERHSSWVQQWVHESRENSWADFPRSDTQTGCLDFGRKISRALRRQTLYPTELRARFNKSNRRDRPTAVATVTQLR